MSSQPTKQKSAWPQTAVYFIGVTGFGAVAAFFGPVLPALALQMQTNLGKIGLLFTFRAMGFFLGSLFGGRIYDRFSGHPLLAGALLIQAAAFAVVPLINEFWLLMLIVLVMGTAGGLLLVGSNTLVVWTHPDNVGPWINGLNFFGGAGGFLSPIFITGFLALTGEIRWAFWALTLLMVAGAVYMMSVSSPVIRKREDVSGSDDRINYGLVFLFALVFLLYVGAEISFSGWMYTVTVALHPNATASAALLVSAFWGAIAAGRLLAIPISSRLRPRTILMIDFLGALTSLIVILTLADSLTALWVGTIVFGLCMASLFPTWMAFADRRIKVNGKITGIFFAGTALGAMSFPWLCGRVFAARGPQATMLVIFSVLLAAAGIYTAMRFFFPPQADQTS
ncbi:MAG: MFS transporter [Anaerolineaceae bacterium]|nr:MFS transporter [Anaerolineaceae bacterium]